MNARLYDPAVGRFLSPDPYVQAPNFSQNFNRYSYALNNPLKYTDEDGEFFWTFVTAVRDFFKNVGRWAQGKPADWHSTKMAWQIDLGMYRTDHNKNFWGRAWELLSRHTGESVQTWMGYYSAGTHNLFEGVKSITNYGGATVLESYSTGWGAITLGNYTIGQKGITADPDNWLFQHEYGHYIQSQKTGPFYMQRYAIPSFFDTLGKSNHNNHAVEQDANIRAYQYFMKNVDGFNATTDGINYPNGQWHYDDNPINGYNWSLDYNDADNQLALKKGRVRLKWWDYVFGPTTVVPGFINVFNLKQ
jgi:hypothetical protein